MARIRTSSALELLIPLDLAEPLSLHRQLERQLREAVRTGRLAAEAELPSSRALAEQLGVSRGIVVEAYEQLAAEGYLATRPGGATRVARAARPAASPTRVRSEVRFDIDFRPGRPDVEQFPREAWLRSYRRVLSQAPAERLTYLEGRGTTELREELARYLNRVRGTAADPENVVISSGFSQGLSLVCKVLTASARRRIGVEDPSHPEFWSLIRAAGPEVTAVAVDESGVRIDKLEAANVDAVVLTPAHQYPTGAVLQPERRAALVSWATRGYRVVIEDDYDAEYRYDREPIGAIQGLSPEHVVYAGSTSKILAPGLRLGWLVVPARLVDEVASAKKAADQGSSALDQLALADFVSRGELDRHLRRVRPIYRRRRDALLESLGRHLPALRPVGASAGLHVLAWLPDELDERAVVEAARQAGVGLYGVSEMKIARTGPGGIVFGYASVPEKATEEGIRRLAAAIGRARRIKPARQPRPARARG